MTTFARYSSRLRWLIPGLMIAITAACGGSGGARDPILGGDVVAPSPPVVTAVSPIQGANGVPVNTKMITAAFNKAMDPASLVLAGFRLNCPATAPAIGTGVTYQSAGYVATLALPAGVDLPANTVCTATVTTGAKDTVGIAMANNFVWTFTTGNAIDTTAPTVSATVPTPNAVGVSPNTFITATFSEAMDPLTISSATVSVACPAAVPVAGSVGYVVSGNLATFTPASPLPSNTTCAATITTGVKDVAGNPMASVFIWMFTTGAVADTTAPMVSSTDPSNGAVAVPVNKRIAATFSEPMDPLTMTTNNVIIKQGATPVAGTLTYAGSTITFNPAANLSGNALYTATITTGAKDLAGNALAANYVWSFTTGSTPDTTAPQVSSTDPANAATGVALNKNILATFTEAMDPLSVTTATMTLKQGVTPVVATVTYVGTTVTLNPVAALTGSTVYTATITTGAKDLAGNPLAANYVWTFITGAAPDVVAPIVITTDPVNLAIGVALNKKVAATFSEAMDPLTISTATMNLKQGLTPIAGAVSYVGTTATFSPTLALLGNTVYTATVTAGAKDLAGNPLAADYVWSFTTGAAPDTIAPTLTSTDPINGAIDVPVTKLISGSFSEAMDPLTVTTATMTLKQGANSVAGTVNYVGTTATFSPTTDLAPSTLYTANITNGAQDLAGNALVAGAVSNPWTFTTAAAVIPVPQGPAAVNLDCVAAFGILAGSTVTNTGPTIITGGDLGLSPGSAVTGFPPGVINGGVMHVTDPIAASAKLCLTAAYNDAAGRTLAPITVSGNIGGLTLAPGLYKSTSTLAVSSGDLTLAGPADAVWIFQIASTLTTTAGRQIILSGGAQAKNVFWQVGTSATLGTNSVFQGNILADQSITLTTGAVLNGRALTRIGAVALDSNTVTKP